MPTSHASEHIQVAIPTARTTDTLRRSRSRLGHGSGGLQYSLAMLPPVQAGLLFGGLILIAAALSFTRMRLQFTLATFLGLGNLSGFMCTTAAVGAAPLVILYQIRIGTKQAGDARLPVPRLRRGDVGGVALGWTIRFPGGWFWTFIWWRDSSSAISQPSGSLAYLDRAYSRFAVLLVSSLSALALIVKSFLTFWGDVD